MTVYALAGGCFWCLDAVFRRLRGVTSSICGYVGGNASDAEYYKVASGTTTHAESVQVTFDETVLPKNHLLDIFFLIHDPTTKDRQGADVGPQYRSVLFYDELVDKDAFIAAKERAQDSWDQKIVTEITKLSNFYPAETVHQDYFTNNPANPYCSAVINPKLIQARTNYAQYFKEEL